MRCPLCDAPESWAERLRGPRTFCNGCGFVYVVDAQGECIACEKTNHVGKPRMRPIKPQYAALALPGPEMVTMGLHHYGQLRTIEIPRTDMAHAKKQGWFEVTCDADLEPKPAMDMSELATVTMKRNPEVDERYGD